MPQKTVWERCELDHHTVDDGHICKTERGFGFAQLRWLMAGSCVIGGEEERSCGPDTLIYIPPDTPYELRWHGEGGAAFYVLEFSPDLLHIRGGVRAVSCDDLTERFVQLERALEGASHLGGLACCFALLAVCEERLGGEVRREPGSVDPAIEYLHAHCTENIRIETLAGLCHLSESRFYSVFRRQTGQSPIRYKNAVRIRKAAFLLRDGYTEDAICERLNFCSASFFRRMFKAATGMTPTEYMHRDRTL